MPSFASVIAPRQSTSNGGFSPVHYPPTSSPINNLTFALGGSGTNGQLWTPNQVSDKQYGTYNYCNMPHVRTKEYKQPKGYKLQYVEVVHRHHKRTPYASNTFFKEDIPWGCSDSLTTHGASSAGKNAVPVTPVGWQGYFDSVNPMSKTVGPGFVGSNCQFPQITAGGLADSYQHGKDLADVYQSKLKFLPKKLDSKKVSFRVTNNVITSQVASALIPGMFKDTEKDGYAALIQSSTYDSLEPTYSCRAADNFRSSYEGSNANWTASLTGATNLYKKLDSVSGIDPNDNAGWHTSIDHYFDNLSSKLCHSKSLPCSTNSTGLCVTQEEADTVFRLGQWMYSYRFRVAPRSVNYATLRYAAWMLELRSHIEAKMGGGNDEPDSMLYRHNVAHDGSMSALLGLLQIDEMVWPGMGAEVVFELYKATGAGTDTGKRGTGWAVRVLWGGRPMKTSTPLGTLDMVPVDKFFAYFDQQLPRDLRAACSA